MAYTNTQPIDFVIPWVDGEDPLWKQERDKYDSSFSDMREERFRNWDNLKYWFRGVETCAPWVNKIHFITWGHIPDWMNTDHPKLHLVKHQDYIPKDYLPVFSANPIELNLHRIKGLSEQFVYFNDDTFIVDKMLETDFFRNGKPCSCAGLGLLGGNFHRTFAMMLYNDYRLLDRHFSAREVLKKHRDIFINRKYSLKQNFKTLLLTNWCKDFFPGFLLVHSPNPFLKSTLEEVWEKEEELLKQVTSHKFRSVDDVNQYIFQYWQWCKGDIEPVNIDSLFAYHTVAQNSRILVEAIQKPKVPLIAINDDTITYEDYLQKREMLINAFKQRFPQRSEFEKK